jgi:acetyl-CoA acetyltransferase
MYSRLIEATRRIQGWDEKVPIPFQVFGGAAIELQEKYGVGPEVFAMISVKARQHAAHNTNALFRDPLTVEEVLASKPVFGPLTRFQCSPPTCGAAAVVIVSERFKRRAGLSQAILIAGQGLATDTESSFEHGSMIKVSGHDVSRRAADIAYERAGLGPEDVDVVELHDCFSSNELVCYEALRLAEEGGGARMVMDRDNTYGGKMVVNPSGGLLAKGHPIGATGVAQIAELVWQLRGSADRRQVPGARVGLQHNIGLGSASVVTILRG